MRTWEDWIHERMEMKKKLAREAIEKLIERSKELKNGKGEKK